MLDTDRYAIRRTAADNGTSSMGHAAHLKLGFSSPFDWRVEWFGLIGVFGNAFLAGALDDRFYFEWHASPLLKAKTWRCVSEGGLTLEANGLAEWLGLLRVEGATALRLHFEAYPNLRMRYGPALKEQETRLGDGIVLSGWRRGFFGRHCVSSWVLATELSRVKIVNRQIKPGFPVPADYGGYSNELLIRTHRPLDGARSARGSTGPLLRRLDKLYALGRAAGYVSPELAAQSQRRIGQLIEHYSREAPAVDPSPFGAVKPMRCIPRHPYSEGLWRVLVDAGLLRDQLRQMPWSFPPNPHDSLIPHYPETDANGEIYRALEAGLEDLGRDWLRLCFRPWPSSTAATFALEAPADLAYLDRASVSERGIGLTWVRFAAPA